MSWVLTMRCTPCSQPWDRLVKSSKALFVRGVAVDKESMEAAAREWVGNKKG